MVAHFQCGNQAQVLRVHRVTSDTLVKYCRWTGITVSKEQLAEATARVKAAGLSDRITLLFCDYRYCVMWRSMTCALASQISFD